MKQDVFEKILDQFNKNINSHVFLFNTNNKERCLEELKKMIAKIIDADENTINQIINELYIELIIIRNESREIKTDQIAFLLDKIKTKPILSKYIFYIINDAESLNIYAANKLLKTIEEPNNDIVGMLITDKIGKILPTIKSRCEIIDVKFSENGEYNSEYLDEAFKLIEFIETKKLVDFNLYKMNNSIINENSKEIMELIVKIYNSIYKKNKNDYSKSIEIIKKNNNKKVIIRKIIYLNNIYSMINSNMNKDLLFEKIFIDFKEMK